MPLGRRRRGQCSYGAPRQCSTSGPPRGSTTLRSSASSAAPCTPSMRSPFILSPWPLPARPLRVVSTRMLASDVSPPRHCPLAPPPALGREPHHVIRLDGALSYPAAGAGSAHGTPLQLTCAACPEPGLLQTAFSGTSNTCCHAAHKRHGCAGGLGCRGSTGVLRRGCASR